MQKHKVYLQMCNDLSSLSKCSKHKVGALLVKNDRIISNGLNGSPSGYTNCCDKFQNIDTQSEPGRSEHRKWSLDWEVHAEMNVLMFAAKNGVNTNNSVLYCNLEPCYNCLKHMVMAGVKEIYFSKKHKYNLETPEALDLINTLGIKVTHINI